MAKLKVLPGPAMAKVFFRSASCVLRVRGWPSRLIPSVTRRPGGISRIMRRNCSTLSTWLPLMLRITSCSLIPALPAGASWSTRVTSTPCSSFSFRSAKRSGVTSRVSTPRYDPPPKSSLEYPKASLKGSCEHSWPPLATAANIGRISTASIDVRMFVPLFWLAEAGHPRPAGRARRPCSTKPTLSGWRGR